MKSNPQLTLFPTNLFGEIDVPPSKSLSHRSLICASLAHGKSTISNILLSDDIKATITALEHLGAKFEINGDTVTVIGPKKIKYNNNPVDCNESGSTIRFLIPIFSLTNKEIQFTGKESLIKRPQSIYSDIFKEDNNTFEIYDNKIVVKGSVKSRDYFIPGNVSSQFISGLLFSLPFLKTASRILITGELESKSYIDLTIDVLDHYGIEIQEFDGGYFIPGNQTYHPRNYKVEGDYSQSAFYLVAGIINGPVVVNNLSQDSLQGDRVIIDIIRRMKGRVIFTENGFITEKSTTRGTTIDISDCPDLGPIIALLGSLSKGKTTITNISRLRIKESDRVNSTVKTLSKLGANITVVNEEIIIHGKQSLQGGVTLDSYNDHRIAMMISIAATRCKKEIVLTGSNAVNKSYPHFFKDYKSLGGKIKVKD